jgi:hypothetical protein
MYQLITYYQLIHVLLFTHNIVLSADNTIIPAYNIMLSAYNIMLSDSTKAVSADKWCYQLIS